MAGRRPITRCPARPATRILPPHRAAHHGAPRRAASAPASPSLPVPRAKADATSRPSQIASSARLRSARVRAARIGPPFREGGIDRLQHRAQPLAQVGAIIGNALERDAGLSWILASWARTRRWPIVAGETRKAEAIVAASKPSTACRISGARTPASIAGCAQANIRGAELFVGNFDAACALPPPRASSAIRRRCADPALSALVRRSRAASIILRRATVSSHASGFDGTPPDGQPFRAAAKASDSASSAPATSPLRAARKATSLP